MKLALVALATIIYPAAVVEADDKPWYERLKVGGYLQLRYNRLYVTDEGWKNDLGDKALADGSSFSMRRARLIVQGDVLPWLTFYTQTDAAGADVKMRDWYGDVAFDDKKELRLRLGQSKVPYGFENMQSSSNRAPLDRSDPINSAAPGERDLGAFLYWAPSAKRKLFKQLVDDGLKGSGDFGVIALGAYAGQGVNFDDKDGSPHLVARLSYPIEIGGQVIEPGVQGYAGTVTPEKSEKVLGGAAIRDARAAVSLVVYPQPIGFQLEYNAGVGPELDGDTIRAKKLHGGYAMIFARVRTPHGDFVPFARGAYYRGGIKSIKDAPRHESDELAAGLEWQLQRRLELTVEMDHARRVVGDATVWGTIFRMQAQLSY